MIEKIKIDLTKEDSIATANIKVKLNEVIDWINDDPKRKLSEARPNPLLNDIKPTKKLDIKHAINLLKIGASTKVVKLINDSFEDPNSLFELPSQEKLNKLQQELRPEYIGDQWAMCPDCGKAIYSSHSLEIDHSQCDLDKESGIQ